MFLKNTGQTLIEILLTVGLMALLLPALLTGFVASREGQAQQQQKLEAVAIQRELSEALRSIRERGWDELSLGTYYPEIFGGEWVLTPGTKSIGGFDYDISISEDVQRNSSGDIVTIGGNIDPSTKRLVASVRWGNPATTLSNTYYMTRYLDNIVYEENLDADFTGGSMVSTVITGDSIQLSTTTGEGQPGIDWCQPASAPQFALNYSGSAPANAVSAVYSLGEAFVATGNNASSPTFVKINQLAYPPNPTEAGIYNDGKANDIFVEGTTAYIGRDTNNSEVVAINTTNLSVIRTFDTPGSADASSVFVYGNYLLVTAGNNLYTFNKTTGGSTTGSAALGAAGTSVYAVGGFAYVTRNSTSQQLRIFRIESNGALTTQGTFTPASPGARGGKDVVVSADGTKAYLVTSLGTGLQKEFFIVDTTTKTGTLNSLGSYDTNNPKGDMSPNAVEIVLSGTRALLGGNDGEEYQVVNISTPSNPTYCGGLDVANLNIRDLASALDSVNNRAYVYIVTSDSSGEFKVIEGGPGNKYPDIGTYESKIFPVTLPVNDIAFNRFDMSFTKPGNSSVELQFAIVDPVSGFCSGADFTSNYVGLNGVLGAVFTDDAAIPLDNDSLGYENPAKCMKYKVILRPTSDKLTSPIFDGIKINYTP